MKTFANIAFLMSVTLVIGCAKKDTDSASAGSTAAPPASAGVAAPAAATPTAAAPTAAAPAAMLTAADVPAGCKPFMDALAALDKCEKIPADQRATMAKDNQRMLKAMVDLHDDKASVDGCNTGLPALQSALKTAGC